MLGKWDDLPDFMRVPEVRRYYDILAGRRGSLLLKKFFDFIVALILLVLLAIPMLLIAAAIKLESHGPVFFRQERITTNGRSFKIHKFRTMIQDAEKYGPSVTLADDSRTTRIGRVLRFTRMDELPQLIDVLSSNMSFVGTRPEVRKYVEQYTPEMMATLLMPAGITSEASIRFKDEASLMTDSQTVDMVYMNLILPQKMKWNLKYIEKFSFFEDVRIMFATVGAVLGLKNTKHESAAERETDEHLVH